MSSEDVIKNENNEESTKADQIYKMSNENWKLTLDVMMIIGKYFMSSTDFINVMKLSKKFNQLNKMYHYNPITQ